MAKAKTGRPSKPYRTRSGETIDGLYHKPGTNIWRIRSTGFEFRENDEHSAVARFRSWQARNERHHTVVPIEMPTSVVDGLQAMLAPENIVTVEATPTRKIDTHGRTHSRGGRITLAREVPQADFWAHARDQLLNRPEWVAEQTGIPELARLADLPQRKPSPTLSAIGEMYFLKKESKINDNELGKSKLFWSEFVNVMKALGVTAARQVTSDAVGTYGEHVEAAQLTDSLSPTYIRHRFGKIKAIFNFARKKGLGPDVRDALDACATLEPPAQVAADPNPIERGDFRKLLDAANDRMRAAMLMMLNFCMYPSEACNLEWREINLKAHTLSTDRNKTKVVRVAVIWERTIDALAKLPRRCNHVLSTHHCTELSRWTLADDWRVLREKLGLHKLQMNMIRDGAYTASVEAGVKFEHAQMLGGHQTGIADKYVKRGPTMVADACAAIEKAYCG
jgi:integrase